MKIQTLTIPALVILIFIPQLFVFPIFLNLDNEAKILLFCFISFLLATFFVPDRMVFVWPDTFLFLILLIPSFSAVLTPYYGQAIIYLLLIVAIFYYRYYLSHLFLNISSLKVIFLRSFSIFVLTVSLFGLYEYFSFIVNGKSLQPLIPYLLPPDLTYRVVGIYGQPNFTALLMLLGLLVCFYLYLHDRTFESRRLSRLRYLPFVVIALVFFLTGSRAGLLAFFLTVFPLAWLVVRCRYLTGDLIRRRQFIFLCGMIFVAYLISVGLDNRTLFCPDSFSSAHNLNGLTNARRGLGAAGMPTESRFVLWTSAILMFKDHPWLGIGLENFKLLLPQYLNQAHDLLGFVEYEAMVYTNWAHNEFLQLSCEGGVLVLLALLAALVCLFYPLLMFAMGRREWSSLKLYSHLFLVPFVIHSSFSWPLRHCALLIFFSSFVVLLLSVYEGKLIHVTLLWRHAVRFFALCGLIATLFIVSQELRMGSLAKVIKTNQSQTSFAEFEQLVSRPYSEYSLLLRVVPRYINTVLVNQNADLGRKVLPYARRITEIQGVHWQWFQLAQLYLFLDRRDDAMAAITKAIDLKPPEEIYWNFQHYLNMLKASEQTGRPVDDFLPLGPGQTPEDLKGIFDFANRIKIYK